MKMASANQQPLLISVLNAQTDTIDAHKKLIAYMNKHITELEQLCVATKKDLDNAKSVITTLNGTIDDLKRDNMVKQEEADVASMLEELEDANPVEDKTQYL